MTADVAGTTGAIGVNGPAGTTGPVEVTGTAGTTGEARSAGGSGMIGPPGIGGTTGAAGSTGVPVTPDAGTTHGLVVRIADRRGALALSRDDGLAARRIRGRGVAQTGVKLRARWEQSRRIGW